MAASAATSVLPAVMREGLVGLGHAVDVVLALERAALLGDGVHELVREALGHGLLAAVARELDQPADRERAGAAGGDLDRDLVGRAADAAGADLEVRGQGLDGRLELLEGVLARLLGDD